jgi:hypothetical protein
MISRARQQTTFEMIPGDFYSRREWFAEARFQDGALKYDRAWKHRQPFCLFRLLQQPGYPLTSINPVSPISARELTMEFYLSFSDLFDRIPNKIDVRASRKAAEHTIRSLLRWTRLRNSGEC